MISVRARAATTPPAEHHHSDTLAGPDSPFQTCLHLARVEVEVRRWLEVQRLSLSELAAPDRLATAPDRTCRRQELCDALGFTPSGVTRLLTPLEKLGYVTRIADPRDARRAWWR